MKRSTRYYFQASRKRSMRRRGVWRQQQANAGKETTFSKRTLQRLLSRVSFLSQSNTFADIAEWAIPLTNTTTVTEKFDQQLYDRLCSRSFSVSRKTHK